MTTYLVRQQERAAWLFLSPALSLIGLFFVVPVVAGLLISLTDFDIYAIGSPGQARFVGLANYRDILASPVFWQAVRNTLYFAVVGGPIAVAASLGAALMLHMRVVRLRGVFRLIYFAPVVTSLVPVAIIWRYLYHPRYGVLNRGLELVGIAPIDWLGDPHWSMPAIIILAVWKNFGYNMLIFMAGLGSIPQELYDAASIDGAGPWWRFRQVTVPGLRPVLLFVAITTMIGFLQLFAEPYVMTQGGPLGSTRTIVLLMYEEGFRWWRMGVSSTIAALLLGTTLLATLVQLRVGGAKR